MPLSRAVQRIVFPSLVVSFFPSMVKDTVFIFSLCFHHEVTEVTENEYFCLSRLGGTNKKSLHSVSFCENPGKRQEFSSVKRCIVLKNSSRAEFLFAHLVGLKLLRRTATWLADLQIRQGLAEHESFAV